MKHLIYSFFLLFCIASYGQEKLPYDEEILLGSWKATGNQMEVNGDATGPIAVGNLSLKANSNSYISSTNPITGYSSYYEFSTFFVSDNNKLHLISKMPTQMNSFTFVINGLEYDSVSNCCFLYLRPLGSSEEEYFVLTKQGGYSGISQQTFVTPESNKRFDLSGTETISPNGVYIQNGKKFIAK